MAGKYVLFVHGVGEQQPGYSDKLWDVLWKDTSVPDIEKRELFYYDVFRDAEVKNRVGDYAEVIGDKVNDLISGLWPGKNVAPAVAGFCTDTMAHLAYFLALGNVKTVVLERFRESIRAMTEEALDQGVGFPNTEITVVSHSLGTVVSYLGLHELANPKDPKKKFYSSVKSLYTLATPLEFIRTVSDWVPAFLNVDHITAGITRPVTTVGGSTETNIRQWFSFRHKWDPVASLVPVRGKPVKNPDEAPFTFGDFQLTHTHDFDKYIEQARGSIRSRL